jgi:hypothetical protein
MKAIGVGAAPPPRRSHADEEEEEEKRLFIPLPRPDGSLFSGSAAAACLGMAWKIQNGGVFIYAYAVRRYAHVPLVRGLHGGYHMGGPVTGGAWIRWGRGDEASVTTLVVDGGFGCGGGSDGCNACDSRLGW